MQRATSQGGPYTTVAEGLSETSFTDTGLSNGTTYYYVVTAENAAGSTNSNEVSATPQEQSTSADLVIEYRVGDTNPTDNQMKPQLRIVNEGTEDVSLSDLTVRYWFTNDSEKDMQYFCDWAAVGCSNINASIVDMSQPAAEADAYLELTFTSGAGTLGAGSHTGDIQNRLHYTDWSNFDENNDYSYNETQTQYAPADNIAIYQNGQLVWGTEPQ